ncbi:DUF2357 domain-containing protein [Embleya sp. MST-111070]|uniref:DUF2357 domain-containing protein n=1 Tax=Embleya sp. MST-111070 TaxID=3398231 RepID=UPI003F7416BB
MRWDAAEPDLDSLLARHLSALSTRLAADTDGGLDDWLAMPPIVLGVSAETDPLPLEEAFEWASGALRTVCHRPYTRLRSVEEVLPVSRVRSVAAGAVAYLAAHPQDWAAHTIAGVRPRRLSARRNEEDADIYENRVAVAVLLLLRTHLRRRIAGLRALSRMEGDVHGLLNGSEETTWRTRRDLTQLLGNVGELAGHATATHERLRKIEAALTSVQIMLEAPLAKAVGHRHAPARELHPTNLLVSDASYRRVAELWRVCTKAETPRIDAGENERRQRETRTAFERFTGLLLLSACTIFRATPDRDQPAPAPGRTTRFQWCGVPLTVTWSPAGDFLVHWREQRVLRVIPTMTDLCSAPDAASVGAALVDLRRERVSAPEESGRVLVVYPGALDTRRDAVADVVDAAYRIGHDSGPAAAPGIDVAPLSPLEIFSVSRLVRALYWATLGADARRYPHLVSTTAGERSMLAACEWLEPRADAVAVLRVPSPKEWERVSTLLRQVRPYRAGGKPAGREPGRATELYASLESAVRATTLLQVCPICPKTATRRPTTFVPREPGMFAASCSSCGTRWELRRCPACAETFPVLSPDGHIVTGGSESDLDRHLGGAFLAMPCWARGRSGAALCPACGNCGRATRDTSCPRACHESGIAPAADSL